MKNLDRNISLHCNVCGNDQFSAIDSSIIELEEAPDETKIKCSDCGRIITKAELIEENQELINTNIEDIKKEAVSELEKELKKMFKKFGR